VPAEGRGSGGRDYLRGAPGRLQPREAAGARRSDADALELDAQRVTSGRGGEGERAAAPGASPARGHPPSVAELALGADFPAGAATGWITKATQGAGSGGDAEDQVAAAGWSRGRAPLTGDPVGGRYEGDGGSTGGRRGSVRSDGGPTGGRRRVGARRRRPDGPAGGRVAT
jgi:hypothetical protein